jgi:multicomponent Na+:H+ antiporter subunit B
MGRKIVVALEILTLLAVGVFLLYVLNLDPSALAPLRDYFLQKGVEDTGSINLTSSIYLGYRAFDTLGETVIMLISVLAVIVILGAEE